MTNNFNILVYKLNSFRIKYYTYKFLKGFILSFFLLLLIYTVFILVEYFVYLSTDIRKVLFYGFLIFGGLLTLQFILIPVFKLLHIIKPIDIKTTTVLVQKHFKDIEDKLLNIIELAEISDSTYSNEIVLASIDQKIEKLNVFDFSEAVQFKNLRIVLSYFLFSLFVSATIFISNKSVYTSATHRLLNYNTAYTKPAPFSFQLMNSDLKATKGDAYKIQVQCEGDEIPQILYINIDGNNYLMKNTAAGKFEFEMASVINPVTFYFTDLKYNSEEYFLELLPKPGITNFDVHVSPPAYTGLPDLEFENTGDLQVPNGTEVEWNFQGIDIDTLYLALVDSNFLEPEISENGFTVYSKFFKSTNYSVYIKNILTEPELAFSYNVEVIPDLYPEIEVVRTQDSVKMTRYFFKGVIGDDYGFSELKFHYNINYADSAISIPVQKNLTDQVFYFGFDFNEIETNSGMVSYYFSVTDNDVINNYKTTTSNNYIFEIPDRETIAENENEQFKNLENMLNESQELAKEIQDDLQNLQLKNMDSNVSEWDKSQMVEEILSKQSKLEKLYNRIKGDNEKLNNFTDSFKGKNDEIREKQAQIEELLDEVFTDELKELLEEFEKLSEEFDSKKLNRLSDQMDMSYDDLQKQLDRNLQMLRRMKVEQKLQNVIDDINRMAIEEENLAEEVSEKSNFEEVKEKVSEHQEELDRVKEDLSESLLLNEQLEKPLNFDNFSDELEDIGKSMEESKNELDKKNRKKSGARTKETSGKMESTAFSMQQMLNSNSMEQNMENIQNLRQILSNLIFLSFEQEEVLAAIANMDNMDPSMNEFHHQQKRISDQSKIVKDSLYALARRTPQISNKVNNELLTMQLNLKKAIELMEEDNISNARVSQQYVMTASNNLALLLNEALENLEEQMANAQPGDQECQNPGNGKPGMNMLKETSEDIQKQLEQMIEQMKNGGEGPMNQQLGRSLMQHEMMQQMLREIMNDGSVGSDARKTLQQIDNILEQNRKQLMNKNVNAEMLERQNQITTRLLEAEKSELEREFEDERESQSAEDFYSDPVKYFEYEEDNNFSIEYLQRNAHKLNNFYNNKYKQYLKSIEEKSN